MQHVPHAAAGSRPKAPALDEGSEQAASGGGLGLSGGDGGGGAGMADWSFADDSLPLGLAPSVSLAVVVCCGVVWCGVVWSGHVSVLVLAALRAHALDDCCINMLDSASICVFEEG